MALHFFGDVIAIARFPRRKRERYSSPVLKRQICGTKDGQATRTAPTHTTAMLAWSSGASNSSGKRLNVADSSIRMHCTVLGKPSVRGLDLYCALRPAATKRLMCIRTWSHAQSHLSSDLYYSQRESVPLKNNGADTGTILPQVHATDLPRPKPVP